MDQDGVVIKSESHAPNKILLRPEMWEHMTFIELIDQKNVLLDRYDALYRNKKTEEIKFYDKAIARIESIMLDSQT